MAVHDLQHIRSRAGGFVPDDEAARASPGPFFSVPKATKRALGVSEHSRKADHWAGERERHLTFLTFLVQLDDLPTKTRFGKTQ